MLESLKSALVPLVLFVAVAVGMTTPDTVHARQKSAAEASAARKKNLYSAPAIRRAKPRVQRILPNPAARGGWVPDVRSSAAIVVEQSGGGALFQKNARAVMPIASISKLMTAMVVLDGSPNLQEVVSISEEDVDYLRGSRSRLHVGSMMTRETALLVALMSSENRAANALARHYPGGMPAFVAAMNRKAASLGMRDTRFEDPTGLSSGNVSTARDLARMASEAYRYPIIREFSTTPDAVVEIDGRSFNFYNTNSLVKSAAWDVGLSKTGYIQEAGKCLVMQARVAAKPVVIVLLDSAGKQTRVGDANRIRRWMETSHGARAHASFGAPDRPG